MIWDLKSKTIEAFKVNQPAIINEEDWISQLLYTPHAASHVNIYPTCDVIAAHRCKVIDQSCHFTVRTFAAIKEKVWQS